MTLLYRYRANSTLAGRIDIPGIGQFFNIPVAEMIDADVEPYFKIPTDSYFFQYVYKWAVFFRINDFIDNPLYQVYSGYPIRKRVGHYTIRRGDANVHHAYLNYQWEASQGFCCYQGTTSYGDDLIQKTSDSVQDLVLGGVSAVTQYAEGASFTYCPTATNFSYYLEAPGNADLSINYLAELSIFDRNKYPDGGRYDDFVYVNL